MSNKSSKTYQNFAYLLSSSKIIKISEDFPSKRRIFFEFRSFSLKFPEFPKKLGKFSKNSENLPDFPRDFNESPNFKENREKSYKEAASLLSFPPQFPGDRRQTIDIPVQSSPNSSPYSKVSQISQFSHAFLIKFPFLSRNAASSSTKTSRKPLRSSLTKRRHIANSWKIRTKTAVRGKSSGTLRNCGDFLDETAVSSRISRNTGKSWRNCGKSANRSC